MIEAWGECMSGYVPERPKITAGCSERLYPIIP